MLSLFTHAPCLGVMEVARALACSKSAAFQALDTLFHEGFLVRDVTGARYQLGHQASTLMGDGAALDVRQLCRSTMQRLHVLTGQSLFLSVMVGRYNICIDTLIVAGDKVGYSPISMPIPLRIGTGSRLLLAYLSDAEIDRYIALHGPFAKLTPTTFVTPEEIWREVHAIRARGHAWGLQDHSTGANYIAFPVFDAIARPIAALVVGGPSERWTETAIAVALPDIQAIVDALNVHSRVFSAAPFTRF